MSFNPATFFDSCIVHKERKMVMGLNPTYKKLHFFIYTDQEHSDWHYLALPIEGKKYQGYYCYNVVLSEQQVTDLCLYARQTGQDARFWEETCKLYEDLLRGRDVVFASEDFQSAFSRIDQHKPKRFTYDEALKVLQGSGKAPKLKRRPRNNAKKKSPKPPR